ncbi:MAG TPA: hypothetical protein VHE34_21210 [Puia sp.]|uniref:hypothetical protein n=1 Tax=Puia sp. TaxID=2045100 RepID=UPI002BFD010F|nr:hypothetical protein [Puia sp.]HVU97763.1 hypothetical protein [Puia sp.]
MDWLSTSHKEEIFKELVDLGFDRPGWILDQAEPCMDPQDPLVKANIFFDPCQPGNQDVGLYLVIKERDREHWYVEQLHLSVQLETQRAEEGVVVLNRKFTVDQGPLPKFDEVLREVDTLVAVEQFKEQCFLQYNLEKELTELGFTNYPDLLRSRTKEADFTIFHTSELFEAKELHKEIAVRFQLVVTPPEKNLPAVLWMIRGSLHSDPAEPFGLRCQAERAFYKFNDRLPHKAVMVQELMQMAKIQKDPYEEVRRRFRIDQSKLDNNSDFNHKQGRLRL